MFQTTPAGGSNELALHLVRPCVPFCSALIERARQKLAAGDSAQATLALHLLASFTRLHRRCKHYSQAARLIARAFSVMGDLDTERNWQREALREDEFQCRLSRHAAIDAVKNLRCPHAMRSN